jgi:hypothetical protein
MRRLIVKTAFGIGLALALIPAASATAATSSFTYTGAEQTFTVPAGVSSVRVVAVGGRGGRSDGGFGARVSGDLAVSPGQVLFVEVGANAPTPAPGQSPPFNGGGAGGHTAGAGGGASDLRTASRSTGGSLSSRLIVAAGGGGGTGASGSGYGGSGGAAGAPGADGAGINKGMGGGAGTASAGGAGGGGGPFGAAGTLGGGGSGGTGSAIVTGGGGGGGGYYGGGGGGGGTSEAYGGGGGGGSSFTGTATDPSVAADTSASPSVTITYTGASTGTGGTDGTPGSTADKTKPALGSLSFSATTFKATSSGSAFSGQKKRKSAPTGTKVSFNLSEPGSVKFTVDRKTKGRKVGRKCKAKTKVNAKKKSCTRWVKVRGSFTVPGKAGKNSFKFRGRIGGKKLKPARYRLNSQATDKARNKSAIKRKSFRIVK